MARAALPLALLAAFVAASTLLLTSSRPLASALPRMAARGGCFAARGGLAAGRRGRRVVVRLIKDPNMLKNLGGAGGDAPQPAGMPGNGLVGMNSDAERMEWDPDNLLGPRESGHLARLEAAQMEERNKAEYDRIVAEQKKEAEIARKRREERVFPEDIGDLDAVINYFLDTHPDDMEHEIARMRPAITLDLIMHMDKVVNQTQLLPEPTQAQLDQMYEYEALSQVLTEGIIMFDTMKMEALRAQENLKFLLTSKDKKSAMLELAGKNEIDDAFITLLDSNAQGAKAAGQDKVAEFLIQLREQASRYIIKPIAVPMREGEVPADQQPAPTIQQ
mmetsp:Transcript_3602/g.7296  ORF Transcript_3602/g.7296 Transcript_3602/m.7296 type:complete len:333 (+) Transcript_3602:40-1038(+)